MGYVTSGDSLYLDVHLTNYGRELLLTDDLSTMITQFGLSDMGIDYRQNPTTGHTTTAQGGFLVDATGLHSACAAGVNDGYKQTSFLHQTDINFTPPSGTDDQVVIGVDYDLNGNCTYYSTLEIDVYLHDYLVLAKHMLQLHPEPHVFLFGQASTATTIDLWKQAARDAFGLQTFSADTISNNSPHTLIKAMMDALVNRSQFLDFYDKIRVATGGGTNCTTDRIHLSGITDADRNNMLDLTQRSWIESTLTNGQDSGFGPYDIMSSQGFRHKTMSTSFANYPRAFPFTLSFTNERTDSGNVKAGAGAGGVGFTTAGFGYLVLPGASGALESSVGGANPFATYPDWNGASFSTLPDYGLLDARYALGFISPWVVENLPADVSTLDLQDPYNNINYSYITPSIPGYAANTYDSVEYVVPTIRIKKPNSEETGRNYYYPITPSLLDGNVNIGQRISAYVPPSGQGIDFNKLTPTTHPLEAFGVFMGNYEYIHEFIQNSMDVGSVAFRPSTIAAPFYEQSYSIEQGGRYYNYLSRLLINVDEFMSYTYQNSAGVGTPQNAQTANKVNQGSTYLSGFSTGQLINGVDDHYLMTIPFTAKIFSDDNPAALPATLTVNIVYNKDAVRQSIGYSGQSENVTNTPYWRPWDITDIRYYGEEHYTLSNAPGSVEFTTDPTYATMNGQSNGKRIFRKIIDGGSTTYPLTC